jgi:hypothetical protein
MCEGKDAVTQNTYRSFRHLTEPSSVSGTIFLSQTGLVDRTPP